MAERHADGAIQRTGTTMKRRGLLAGAAALVAGIAAKQTSQPVAAITDTNFVATGAATNFDAQGTADYGFDTAMKKSARGNSPAARRTSNWTRISRRSCRRARTTSS
jgi:hypothetical protein